MGFAQVVEPVSRETLPAPTIAPTVESSVAPLVEPTVVPRVVEAEIHTVESMPEETEDVAMEVAEIPLPYIAQSQSTPGVHLDVVGSDAIVTVDAALLATPQEPSRVSKAQDLSMYLSRRFNLTPAPPASSVLSPVREVVTEDISRAREVVTMDDP